MDLLKKLSEMPGAPGREELVRQLIHDEVKSHCDKISTDAMGNLICIKYAPKSNASPKRVMIACHMDEIAFIVRHIDDKGHVRLQQLGGFDTRNLFARRVRIQTRKDGELIGNLNPAGKPIHTSSPEERNKIPTVHEFFIDLGLEPEDIKAKVRVGDPVTLVQDFIEMGELCSGKCLDNRVACWLGVRLLQQVKQAKEDLYVVFTVQEEIGIRGATTSAYAVNPDIAIGLDTTLAVDLPGVAEEDRITSLGKGAAIKIMDAYSVSHHELVEEFVALAEQHEIPYQFEVLPLGGTDTAAMQRAREGARAITLSVPTRYIHTVTETIHKRDLMATLELLKRYVS